MWSEKVELPSLVMTVEEVLGLAGYFKEFDRDLEPDERLRLVPSEEAPPFDPEAAPKLDTAVWPPERLQKANRNYAMDYIRTALPELVAVLGPEEAGALGNLAGQFIGRQFYRQVQGLLGAKGDSTCAFGEFLVAMASAQGDVCEMGSDENAIIVRQWSWRLMRGNEGAHPAVFETWNGLWQGCLAVHNRFLVLEVLRRIDYGDDRFEWRIRRGS